MEKTRLVPENGSCDIGFWHQKAVRQSRLPETQTTDQSHAPVGASSVYIFWRTKAYIVHSRFTPVSGNSNCRTAFWNQKRVSHAPFSGTSRLLPETMSSDIGRILDSRDPVGFMLANQSEVSRPYCDVTSPAGSRLFRTREWVQNPVELS